VELYLHGLLLIFRGTFTHTYPSEFIFLKIVSIVPFSHNPWIKLYIKCFLHFMYQKLSRNFEIIWCLCNTVNSPLSGMYEERNMPVTRVCWLHEDNSLWNPVFVWFSLCRKVAGSIPDEVIGFFNWPNPSSRTMALGSTQPLTEINIRNLPGRKRRLAHKADNLTAVCLEKVGASMSHNTLGLHGLLQGHLYLFSLNWKTTHFCFSSCGLFS
jgi:hypothetical protein